MLTWDWEPDSHRVASQTRRSWATDAGQVAIDTAFHAIVTDLVGTPTELVSEDGHIAWQATTSLWGAPIADHDGGTATATRVDCPLRFPGQYHDPETGLHYNLLRYYDPTNAGYASPDPLGLLPAPNDHAYVDNPLTWLDPLGLMAGCLSYPSRDGTGYRPNPNHFVPPHFVAVPYAHVYRMDTRGPEEISRTGFAPRPGARGVTLWGHITRTYPDRPGYSRDDSQWISTGRGDMVNDGVIASMVGTHYVYRINTNRAGLFADVNGTFGYDHPYASQNEYAHEGAIPPSAIDGYIEPNGLLPYINSMPMGQFNLTNDVPRNRWREMPERYTQSAHPPNQPHPHPNHPPYARPYPPYQGPMAPPPGQPLPGPSAPQGPWGPWASQQPHPGPFVTSASLCISAAATTAGAGAAAAPAVAVSAKSAWTAQSVWSV